MTTPPPTHGIICVECCSWQLVIGAAERLTVADLRMLADAFVDSAVEHDAERLHAGGEQSAVGRFCLRLADVLNVQAYMWEQQFNAITEGETDP